MLIVAVLGPRKSGKTSVVCRLIEILSKSLRVAAIKHVGGGHEFEVDVPGKDSWRMRRAGAEIVAVVSDRRLAVIQECRSPPSLDVLLEMITRLSAPDLVIVEGFSSLLGPREDVVKILVARSESEAREFLSRVRGEVLGIVSEDNAVRRLGLPVFKFSEVNKLASKILSRLR